jgi:hypothetical protein
MRTSKKSSEKEREKEVKHGRETREMKRQTDTREGKEEGRITEKLHSCCLPLPKFAIILLRPM